jgi:hypothetical protein
MLERSLIDDVTIRRPSSIKKVDRGYGEPILFENALIRRMLNLAKAGKDDVVFDFGCGWAQNLIIAATEFDVKRCMGIERLKRRYLKAKERVERKRLSDQITIILGEFEDLIMGKSKEAKLEDATIIIYLLDSDKEFINDLSKRLQKGCRLVYHYSTLFPEIKPNAIDHPFYVSTFPFERSSSELDWLKSIVHKEKSSHPQGVRGQEPSAEELWAELKHDYHVIGISRKDVTEYKRRLRDKYGH